MNEAQTPGCDSEMEHNMGLACDWNEWERKVEAREDIDK